MKKRRYNQSVIVLMTLLLFAYGVSCFAVDYYVDGVNGNNLTGDGSQAKPWKTISYAVKKTEANETEDTFYIAAGLYKNDPNLAVFDREVLPMKIRPGTKLIGVDASQVIVDAGFLTETTSRFIEGVPEKDMKNVRIEGITFRNNNITNGTDAPGIYLTNASGIIKNCEFINIKTTGQRGAIYIIGDGISRFDFLGNLVKDCRASHSSSIYGGVLFENVLSDFNGNTVSGCYSASIGNVFLNKFKGKVNSNTIKNGTSSAWDTGGLKIESSGETEIGYNVFDGNGGCRTMGGQLMSYKNSNIRIHHNTIQNAVNIYDAQAALGINQCDAHEVDNNNFLSNFYNSQSSLAGAVYCNYSGQLNFHHNTIRMNNGNSVGAVDMRSCSGNMSRNIIENNRGTYFGAIYLNTSAMNIENNDIIGNTGHQNNLRNSGGIFSEGTAALMNIAGNRFMNNYSQGGHSCLHLNTFKGNITGNLFQANRCSDTSRFALSISLSNATGEQTKIANNMIAANTGNGVFLDGGSADTRFFLFNTLVNQTGNQLVINTDGWNVYNNIFFGGKTSIVENNVFTISLENNLFYKFSNHLYLDNNQDAYDDLPSFEFWKDEAKNNVQADPKFADDKNYDYHLTALSPAIDAAYDGSRHSPGTFPEITTDYDANGRPVDVPGVNNNTYPGGDDYADFDIGADEYRTGAAFSISGKVTDTEGNPIANVDVQLSDLTSAYQATVITSAEGTYTHTNLEQSRYRIIPSQTGLIFWPQYRDVPVTYGDKTDVNFEAIAQGDPTFLRGTVFEFSGEAIPDASVYVYNEQSKTARVADFGTTITTNNTGQFNVTVPAGPGYSILVRKKGYYPKQMNDISAPDDLIIFLEPERPSAPKNLKAWGTASGIRLNWKANPEPSIAGYNIYRDTYSSGAFGTRVNTSLVKTTSFEDLNVTMDGTYWYKVTAMSGSGLESPKSEPVSATAGSINIFVRDARGSAGKRVRIPINLSDAAGVACKDFSIAFTFEYDMLIPIGFEKTILTKDFEIEGAPGSGNSGSEVYLLTGTCSEDKFIGQGAGHIIDIIFDVAAGATGQSAMGFGDVTLKNASGNAIKLTKVGATFTVAPDYILGDVDGDGDVDKDDALLAQRFAVRLQEPDERQFAAGEINGDGIIDAADVSLILRIANGLPINPAGEVPLPEPRYLLILGVVNGEAGKPVEVPLSIKPMNKVCGGDFIVAYDSSLLTAQDVVIDPGITADYILEKNLSEAGLIYITLSDKADAGLAQQTILATLKFNVAATADKNYIPVTWSMGALSRHFGQKVTWEGAKIRFAHGCICVGMDSWLPFQRVVNFIIGKEIPGFIEFILADQSHDGGVDTADPVKMLMDGHGP